MNVYQKTNIIMFFNLKNNPLHLLHQTSFSCYTLYKNFENNFLIVGGAMLNENWRQDSLELELGPPPVRALGIVVDCVASSHHKPSVVLDYSYSHSFPASS